MLCPLFLINAGATYQRIVNMMLKDRIGKIMKVYVDDMLVKSRIASDHLHHLDEMFGILIIYNMKLNLQKCVFEVKSGKFIWFIVNYHGMKATLAKIKTLMEMRLPRTIREI